MSYKITATVTTTITTGKDLDDWHQDLAELRSHDAMIEIDGIDFIEDEPPDAA